MAASGRVCGVEPPCRKASFLPRHAHQALSHDASVGRLLVNRARNSSDRFEALSFLQYRLVPRKAKGSKERPLSFLVQGWSCIDILTDFMEHLLEARGL